MNMSKVESHGSHALSIFRLSSGPSSSTRSLCSTGQMTAWCSESCSMISSSPKSSSRGYRELEPAPTHTLSLSCSPLQQAPFRFTIGKFSTGWGLTKPGLSWRPFGSLSDVAVGGLWAGCSELYSRIFLSSESKRRIEKWNQCCFPSVL